MGRNRMGNDSKHLHIRIDTKGDTPKTFTMAGTKRTNGKKQSTRSPVAKQPEEFKEISEAVAARNKRKSTRSAWIKREQEEETDAL